MRNKDPKISHSEKPIVDTGYEGADTSSEHSDWSRWNLRRIDSGLHEGVMAQVTRNGVVRGILNLKDEAEFKWLKTRIDGDQRNE